MSTDTTPPLVAEIAGAGNRAKLDADNPWPGLDAYGEASKDFFKGRQQEASELLRLIRLSPLTVLYGKSGLGKTSLLEAGLFPSLRAAHYLPVYLRLDFSAASQTQSGVQPLQRAMQRLLESLTAVSADFPAPADGESLWEYLHHKKLELWSADNFPLVPVLVFDQFEELFSRSGGDADLIKQVFDNLADLIENRIPPELATEHAGSRRSQLDLFSQNYRLVLSFREDFLPQIRVWEKQVPSLLRSYLRLEPMSRWCAIKAVEDAGSAVLDEGVAASIVDFVGEPNGAKRHGESADLAIEPVLLSLCCTQLNRSRAPGAKIDKTLLEGVGEGILETFYRDALDDPEVKGPPDVAAFIEDKLLQGDYRGDFPKQEALDKRKLTEKQLTALTDRLRLLRVVPQADTTRIELIHDRLVPVIAKIRDERAAVARQQEQELKAAAAEAERDRERARSENLARSLRAAKRNRNIAWLTVLICFLVLFWGWREKAGKERIKRNAAVAVGTTWLAEGRLALGTGREPLEQTMYRALAGYRLTDKESSQSRVASLMALHWVLENSGHLLKAVTMENLMPTPGLSYSPDGKTIAVGGEDGSIRLVDADTYREQQRLDCHAPAGESVWVLAFSRDGKLAAGFSRSGEPDQDGVGLVCVFDLVHHSPPKKWSSLERAGKASKIFGLAFGGEPDREFVVFGGSDKVVRLLDVESWKVYQSPHQVSDIAAVALSSDGKLAASAQGSNVYVWDVETLKSPIPKPLHELKGHGDTVEQVEFSANDSSRLVSAGDDGRVIVWNIEQACAVQKSEVQPARIYNMALRPGGELVAAASNDGVVRLFNISADHLPCSNKNEFKQSDALVGHGGSVLAVAWKADGDRLASTGQEGSIRIWSGANSGFATAKLLLETNGNEAPRATAEVKKLSISPDGATIAAGDDKGFLRLWSRPADTAEPAAVYANQSWSGHSSAIRALVQIRVGDRNVLVSGADDGVLKRWDVSNKPTYIGPDLADHAQAISTLAVSPDGKTLAAGSKDGVIRLWDPATGVLKATLPKSKAAGDGYELYVVGFSADGKYIAAADSFGSVLIRDLAKPSEERRLTGHQNYVKALSQGGARWLLSAGDDGSVLEWEKTLLDKPAWNGLKKRDEFKYRMGFRNLNALTSMASSTDGKWIVTGGASGQVQLWDGDAHTLIGNRFSEENREIQAVAMASDAGYFVTAGTSVLVWPGPGRWADMMCSKLALNMSQTQWNDWISPDIPYQDQCPGLPRAADK